MRILVDLADRQIKELDALAAKGRRSRAAILREAVDAYVSSRKSSAAKADGFGLWKDSDLDGLAYQKKLREEW